MSSARGRKPPPKAGDEEAEASAEDAEKGKKAKKAKAKGAPSGISFFAVLARAAALMLALGWGFAFIARSGLEPPKPEKPSLQAKAPPLPKAITHRGEGDDFCVAL